MLMPIDERIIEGAKPYLDSPEKFIAYLKDSGVSKSRCVIACNLLLHLSPADAKRAVHFSRAWSNQNTRDQYVQELAFSTVKGKK